MAETPANNGGSVGNTPAEQAGARALRSAALTNRATNPAAVLGPADRALSKKPVAKVPPTAAPVFPLSKAQYTDKLMGMMLLGAYGDALGAAHEMNGLDGKIYSKANPIVIELKPYGTYERRTKPEPFGVWRTISAAETGMPTDDTGVRVMMLHQFLKVVRQINDAEQASGKATLTRPSEVDYLTWLASLATLPSSPLLPQFETVMLSRVQAIDTLLCWYEKAKQYAAETQTEPATFFTCDPAFWEADIPVVFGQFLYLDLAAIYIGRKREDVLADFRRFSNLDQHEAKFSTGLLAAVLSEAFTASPILHFVDFFNGQVEAHLLHPDAPAPLKASWAAGKALGISSANAGLSLNAFLTEIQTKIYNPRQPSLGSGLGKFKPSMFLAQMAAVVQWGSGDPQKTLGALAFGVGDADTIPAQLGAIIGAFYGEQELRKQTPTMGRDLDTVQDQVETYFAASTDPDEALQFVYSDSVETFWALANYHGTGP